MSTPNQTPTPEQLAQTPQSQAPQAPATTGQWGSIVTGQPPAPTAAPTTQPPVAQTAGQPAQPQAAQGQPPITPHQAHVSLYDRVLRGITGPGQTIVAPDGSLQKTGPSLGKSIVASVVSGLLTPTAYRQGNFGPVVDTQATAANAFKAGQDVVTKNQQDAQKMSDDIQARKLQAVANNVQTFMSYSALAHQQHQDIQGVIDQSQPFLTDLRSYDGDQSDPANKLILVDGGLTMSEALNSDKWGKKLTVNNLVMSGYRDTYDPQTGQTKVEPTFTVINPNGRVSLSQDSVDQLAKINPSLAAAWKANSGDLKLGVSQYHAMMQQLHTVTLVESFAKRADEALGVSDKFDLAAAVRRDKSLMPAIREAEAALSQGGNLSQMLQRIQQSPGSSVIFDAMGLDQDKVSQYIKDQANKDLAAQKVAAEAGKIAEQKAKPITPTTALGIANDPNETPQRRQTAQAVIAGQSTLAGSKAAAVAKVQEPFQLRKQMQEQSLKTGTPEDAGRLLANGDLTLTELKSRGSTPAFIISATNAAKAIDPKYNAQKADAEYKIASNQANTTFFGSANSLLDQGGTLDQLAANYQKLDNTEIPYFNKVEDYLGYQAGTPAMAGFMQTALGVADDYAKVMGGGTGSDTSRLQVLHSFSNAHNPEQMQAAIDAARAAVQSQTRSRIGSNAILQKMYGGTYGSTPPAAAPHQTATPKPQFLAVTKDGKLGYNGTAWVPTGK